MKHRLHYGILLWVICGAAAFAQSNSLSTEQKQGPPASNSAKQETGPIDVLSDTNGADFGPYLQGMIKRVQQSWYNVVPDSARSPKMKQGKVSVSFHIIKDGSVSDIAVEESSGDAALDGAAEKGVAASAPFPPLPADFAGQFLALRIHFYYNPETGKFHTNSVSSRPELTEEQQLALATKCSPYVNTKVEDLESKRSPLPPHECSQVLFWMRSERVESLYASEKPSH